MKSSFTSNVNKFPLNCFISHFVRFVVIKKYAKIIEVIRLLNDYQIYEIYYFKESIWYHGTYRARPCIGEDFTSLTARKN